MPFNRIAIMISGDASCLKTGEFSGKKDMSQTLMTQAARCALAELNLVKNSLSTALAELKTPDPDYHRIIRSMLDVAEHNAGQNAALQTLAELIETHVQATGEIPQHITLPSESTGSNVVQLHPNA